MKKAVMTAAALGLFAASAVPAFAETASTTTSTPTVASKITCVAAAVNAREASLSNAFNALTSTQSAAYSARATALKSAYGATTTKEVRTAVTTAWNSFNSSMKTARKAWMTARNAAWNTYRQAAVACKAPLGVGDGAHSENEAAGN